MITNTNLAAVHVYPYRHEAIDALKDIKDPEAIVNFTCMFVDYENGRHIYLAGAGSKRLNYYKPKKYVIHDIERCYGETVRMARYKAYSNKVKIEFK